MDQLPPASSTTLLGLPSAYYGDGCVACAGLFVDAVSDHYLNLGKDYLNLCQKSYMIYE